jgi:thioesterase domain-containing protein
MNALMAEYAQILRPILKDRTTPIITTGFCIGGDMAMRLAVELQAQGIATPSAINIDGVPYRPEHDTEDDLVIEPGISEELLKIRSHFMYSLSRSFDQRHYSGPVHLIMYTKFEDEPGQTREEGLEEYTINLANWEKAQPGMPITYVDSAHMQVINEPESLKIIKEVIDSYAFQGIR